MVQRHEFKSFGPDDPDSWVMRETVLKLKTDDGKTSRIYLGLYLGANAKRDGFQLQTGSEETVEVSFTHITGFDVVRVTELLDQIRELSKLADAEP
jgi:hypothetical protein